MILVSSKKLNSQNIFLDLNNTLMYSEDIQQTIPLEVNKIPEAVVEVVKPSDQLETQSQSNQHGKNVFKIHILTKKLPQKNFSILGIEIRLYIYIVCTCVCLDRSF